MNKELQAINKAFFDLSSYLDALNRVKVEGSDVEKIAALKAHLRDTIRQLNNKSLDIVKQLEKTESEND